MGFKELITNFAARHNEEGLVAEDNAAALDMDGVAVTRNLFVFFV